MTNDVLCIKFLYKSLQTYIDFLRCTENMPRRIQKLPKQKENFQENFQGNFQGQWQHPNERQQYWAQQQHPRMMWHPPVDQYWGPPPPQRYGPPPPQCYGPPPQWRFPHMRPPMHPQYQPHHRGPPPFIFAHPPPPPPNCSCKYFMTRQDQSSIYVSYFINNNTTKNIQKFS